MLNPDAFYTHLEGCAQCRENPFNLCEAGNTIVRNEVVKAVTTIPGGISTISATVPAEQDDQLWAALISAGMQEYTCKCGRPFLTRREGETGPAGASPPLCPPCAGLAPADPYVKGDA